MPVPQPTSSARSPGTGAGELGDEAQLDPVRCRAQAGLVPGVVRTATLATCTDPGRDERQVVATIVGRGAAHLRLWSGA